MPDLQDMTREALCSAFYRLPFSFFVGEAPDPALDGNEAAIFRLNRDGRPYPIRDVPEQANVRVWSDVAGVVAVSITWLNLSAGWDHPIRCEQIWRITTDERRQDDLETATEEVVLKVLDVFKGVLSGDYITQELAEFAPESEAGDPDDEDDMAVSEEDLPL